VGRDSALLPAGAAGGSGLRSNSNSSNSSTGGGGGGSIGGGGGRRLSRGGASGKGDRSAQTPQAVLLFTVSCAAVTEDGVPLPLRSWIEVLEVCVNALHASAVAMSPQDRRVLTAVLVTAGRDDHWLRPALAREMMMDHLVAMGDCYAFRSAASRLTIIVTRMAAVAHLLPTSTTAAMPRLPAIAEGAVETARGHIATGAADRETTAGESSTGSRTTSRCDSTDSAVLAARTAAATASATATAAAAAAMAAAATASAAAVMAAVTQQRMELAVALSEVTALMRQMEYRYLAPFSPMRLPLPPAVATEAHARIATSKSRTAMIAASGRMNFRGMDAATLASMVSDLRRTFDGVAAAVLAAMAEGPVYRLLASPLGTSMLRGAAAVLSSPSIASSAALAAAQASVQAGRRESGAAATVHLPLAAAPPV